VLRDILGALRDRYVEPVALPELAFRAASGLAAVDAGLGLRRGASDWRLTADGRPVAIWRTPETSDAAGWATLLAAFAASAQAARAVRAVGHPGTMAALLDPLPAATDAYTRYVPPAAARAAQGRRRGEGGIGVRAVPSAEGAAIIDVIPESPADHAGLLPGDRILAVDGVRLRGLSDEAIAARLSGEEDTRIVLTVRPVRGGTTRQVAIIRALVVAPSVQSERRGNVAIFRITTFNRLTDQHLARALLDAKAQPEPLTGIVLDLRGNRGGLLRQAVAVADLFLAQGEIVATRGRHPDAARTYVAAGADLADRLPIAVLVDGATASAAEIVAASLQARRRAVVVGSVTLGKGLVQTVVRLPDEGELVMTWSRVVVPPGVPLNDLGVAPTLCTANGSEATAQALAALRATSPPASQRPRANQAGRAEIARARQACPPRDGAPEDIAAALSLLADPAAFAAAVGQPAALAPAGRAPREHLAGAD
jgi:carboxyl-terminal processing protease